VTVKITHEFKVCRCCLLMLGTDEGCDCPDESHPEGLASFKGLDPQVAVVPGDVEFGFMASRRCDGCGTWDGGDRFAVSGLTEN
jgi:hypothetical protein